MLRGIPPKRSADYNLTKDLKAFLLKREKTTTEAPAPEKRQHMDVQVLFSEVETLMNNMDQADARVQRIVAKIHELKTAILLSTDQE